MQDNSEKGLHELYQGVPIDIVVDPRMTVAERKMRAKALIAQACKDAGLLCKPQLVFGNKPLPGPKVCVKCKETHLTGKPFCSAECCKIYTEEAKIARKAMENGKAPRTRNSKRKKRRQ